MISLQTMATVALPLSPPPSPMLAASEPVVAEPTLQKILIVSLVCVKDWTKCFSSCFEESVRSLNDVKPGTKGSIGVCYGIIHPLNELLQGTTSSKERVERIMASEPHHDCNAALPLVGKKGIQEGAVPFYELATGGPVYFGIKRGTKGLWLAKKTGDYFFSAETPIYKHRFPFEIVRNLTDEEAKMPHHLSLIYKKTIEVPA